MTCSRATAVHAGPVATRLGRHRVVVSQGSEAWLVSPKGGKRRKLNSLVEEADGLSVVKESEV